MALKRRRIARLRPAPVDPNQGCHCLCQAMHPGVGCCEGYLAAGGWRIWFENTWQLQEGVPLCEACWRATEATLTAEEVDRGPSAVGPHAVQRADDA